MKLISRALSPLTFSFGFVLALLCCAAHSVHAQQDQTPKRGFQPGGSYALSDIETVNTTNGNLILNLPLASLPAGRGTAPGATLRLLYNSKLFDSRVEHHSGMGGPVGGNDCISPSGVPIPCDSSRIESADAHAIVNAGWNGGGYSILNAQAGNNYNYTMNVLQGSDEGGWRYGLRYQLQFFKRDQEYADPSMLPQCPADEALYTYKLRMAFPDGSTHEFRPTNHSQSQMLNDGYYRINYDGWYNQCSGSYGYYAVTSGMTYYSTDGTYARLFIAHDGDTNPYNNAWTLSLPDGSHITGGNSNQRIYDRNNNYVEIQNVGLTNGHSATKVVDQVGRYFYVEYGAAPNEDNVVMSGVGGQEVRWRIKYKTIWVYKNYTATFDILPPGVSNQREAFASFTVVDQIIIPAQAGSLAYTFNYNGSTSQPSSGNYTTGWGEVSSVTLPTGAQGSYQYVLDGQTIPAFYSDVLQNYATRKDLTYQKEYDDDTGVATETWLYSISPTGSSITGPDGGVSQQFFKNTQDSLLFDSGLVYKSVQPDGTVAERIWKANGSNNSYVKTEFTSVKNAAGSLTKTTIKDYNYDKNGNVTQVREYDWTPYSSVPRDSVGNPTGVPASAPLKRVTTSTYNSPTPDASDTTSVNGNMYIYASAPLLRNAMATSEVGNGSQTLARTEFTYDSATTTGNLTQQKSWDSAKGGYSNPLNAANSVSISHQYDTYGNRYLSTDARGVQTHLTFGAVGGFTGLYATETRAAYGTSVQRTTAQEYDFNTGLVTRATDVDNNVSTATSYDAFGRPTLVRKAEGTADETRTATEYNDAARRVLVRSDLDTIGDGKLVSVQHYDRLGRVRLTRQLENSATESATDETAGIKVQTRYFNNEVTCPDGSRVGSYEISSNPYRVGTANSASAEATMGWAMRKHDSGGRVFEIQTFTGSALPSPCSTSVSSTGKVLTAYDAEFTTVIDQAGRVRRNRIDGMGRLVRVDEPDASGNAGDPNAPAQPTSYTYDAMGNLTLVAQGVQTRAFNYSSLSRLTSATNPESGTSSYLYDDGGNLTRKTDARAIQTNVAYDALGRATSKTYTDGTPIVAYYYDGQTLPSGTPVFNRGYSRGHLVAITYGGGSAGSYSGYDALGRTLTRVQQTDNVNYAVDATYNRAGAMTTETYPAIPGHAARRTVNLSFDATGRLSSLVSAATTYASGASLTINTYTPHGAVQLETLGNGLLHTKNYNSRLQPTEIKLGTTGSPASLLSLSYNYGTNNNNGNLLDVTNIVSGQTIKQAFTYDSLNRLSTTQETNGSILNYWTETNGYDRYGNRWAVVSGSSNMTFDGNNRITGRPYDAVGNLLNDGSHSYTFDAENRIKTVDGSASYAYDGEGQRVRKTLGENVRMVYDVVGQLIAEFDGSSGALKKEYIFGPDGMLATIELANGTRYGTADHLGSMRVLTDAGGGLASRHDYMPFGAELGAGSAVRNYAMYYDVADALRQKFTGYERDVETGLDYAQARFYSSAQARFISADPLYINMKRLFDPQLLNLYSYSRNNPLRFVDPTGLDVTVKGAAQDEYRKKLQQKTPSFQIAINSKGLVRIVDQKGKELNQKALDKLGKSLKDGGEKELFKAITDKNHHATIDTGTGKMDSSITFGRSDDASGMGTNRNSLDMSEIAMLDSSANTTGMTGADVVAHETLEAYQVSLGSKPAEAHQYATQYFGQLVPVEGSEAAGLTDANGMLITAKINFSVRMPDKIPETMRVTVIFDKPHNPRSRESTRWNVLKVETLP